MSSRLRAEILQLYFMTFSNSKEAHKNFNIRAS